MLRSSPEKGFQNHVTGMSAFFFCTNKERLPGHVGSTRLRIMCVSSERDWRLIKATRQPAPSSLLPSVTTAGGTGGDKTDTPTDMLHKEAQVAFKILMTH